MVRDVRVRLLGAVALAVFGVGLSSAPGTRVVSAGGTAAAAAPAMAASGPLRAATPTTVPPSEPTPPATSDPIDTTSPPATDAPPASGPATTPATTPATDGPVTPPADSTTTTVAPETTTAATESTVALPVPAPADNPSLPPTCGLTVMLVVDRSAAMAAGADEASETLGAVLDALAASGATVALVEFADGATQRIGYTALDDASVGAFHDAVSGLSSGGATNWDDGLAAADTGSPDLTLVVTGGAPDVSSPADAHGGHEPAAPDEQPLHFAVQHANQIKAGGSRIFVVGVGGADEAAVAAISGPASGSDVASADHTTSPDPGAIAASVAALAEGCPPPESIEAAAAEPADISILAGPADYTNTAAITITSPPFGGGPQPASVYPSNVTVSGLPGLVTDVDVHLNGLSHGIANDLDILLVGPGGRSILLLSDPGGLTSIVGANNATITFDDSAATGVPQSGPISGTVSYRPTDNDAGETTADSFPAPAPAPSTATTLAGAFAGIDPNGTWSLYIVDDTDGDNGSLSAGWSLTITTEEAAEPTATAVTSAPNPSTTGTSVTFTATVTSNGAPVTAGTVTFTEGTTTLAAGVAVNASGQASFGTSSLAEGSHVITATYNGTPTLLTSNGSVTQVVDTPTTTPAEGTWCNAGGITVPAAGPATPYPSRLTITGVAGTATLVTVTLGSVSHAVPVDLDVLLVGPTGQNVVLMSDVGGTVSATANLTFADSAAGTIPAGGPLASGTYRPSNDGTGDPFPAPAPAPSAATTLATFNGTSPNGTWQLFVTDDAAGDAGSISGGWCLDVSTAAATTTALTSSPNPSNVGQPVTFTATVTSGASPVTGGTVDITEGTTTLASGLVPDTAGQVTFTTSSLAEGSHVLTASYSGTGAFQPSSGTVTHVVQKAATTTTLTSSLNPSTFGQSVTFTATVTSAGAPVTTGSVTFTIDGGAGTVVPLDSSGQATLTTSTLAVGTHTVDAAYAATTAFAASSAQLDQVVDLAPTATVLTSSVNPSATGESVTFTATVTTAGTAVTAGSVTFADGTTVLGPAVALDAAGRATLTTTALSVGSHPITATYGGTAELAASSDTLTQVVGDVVADAGGPYVIDEGADLALDGSASVARAGAAYSWDVNGDGTFGDAIGLTPTLTWSDLEPLGITDGTGAASTVTLRVTDGPTTDDDDTSLTVANVPPTATFDNDGPVTEGSTATVTFSAPTDPSADDLPTLTYSYDFDDDGTLDITGSSPTAVVPASLLADGPSVRTVRGIVADDDGGSSELTTDITVSNGAPRATIDGPSTAVVGEAVTLKVGAVDPSPTDMTGMFDYTVDWGDGTPADTTTGPADPPVTHTYTAPGTFTVTATATDADEATGEPATFTITVSAQPTTTTTAAPTTTAPGATTVPGGLPATSTTAAAAATTAATSTTSTADGDGLAGTGGDSNGALRAGVALVAVGVAVTLLARRRAALRR